jgi:hypothetical protein
MIDGKEIRFTSFKLDLPQDSPVTIRTYDAPQKKPVGRGWFFEGIDHICVYDGGGEEWCDPTIDFSFENDDMP